MSFEMVDREVRFDEANCQTLRNRRANHERTRQTWSAGRRKCINVRHADPSVTCRAFQKSRRVHEMIARSNLGHDSTIFFMRGDLRCDFAGKQLRAGVVIGAAQDRYGGLVARGFEREDRLHKPNCRAGARPAKPATDATAVQSKRQRALISLPLPPSVRSVARKS